VSRAGLCAYASKRLDPLTYKVEVFRRTEDQKDGVVTGDRADHLRPASTIDGSRDWLGTADHGSEHQQIADAIGARV
jgi:hypothetical protein